MVPPDSESLSGKRSWKRVGRSLAAGTVVAALLVALHAVPSGYYLVRPGLALAAAPLVRVDGVAGAGRFLITTVAVREASLGQLLWAPFWPGTDVAPRAAFLPEGQTIVGFRAAMQAEMEESQAAAACAAERQAGYGVVADGRGARVLGVVAGSPWAGRVQAGDVIIAAGGAPVRLLEDLDRAVAGAGGKALDLAVVRAGRRESIRAPLPPQPDRRAGLAALGVEAVTEGFSCRLPVPVTFSPAQVGGPSGGLVFALQILDALDGPAPLAGDRVVAGTGLIWPSGRVGSVGGVRQKVLAARRAGAEVFLVPAAEYAEARSVAGPIRVIPVRTLVEAVAALR